MFDSLVLDLGLVATKTTRFYLKNTRLYDSVALDRENSLLYEPEGWKHIKEQDCDDDKNKTRPEKTHVN
jgi:hypothetical protein